MSDLHGVLPKADESKPYVLVGASIGGIYIRAYQRTYPDEVAALLFTNSASLVGLVTKSGGDLLWKLSEDEIRSAYRLPATARLPRLPRTGQPFDRLPADLQPIRLWLDVRPWESLDPTTMSPASNLSWRRECVREFEETDSHRRPLGSLRVVVISSGPIASDTDRASRDTAAAQTRFPEQQHPAYRSDRQRRRNPRVFSQSASSRASREPCWPCARARAVLAVRTRAAGRSLTGDNSGHAR